MADRTRRTERTSLALLELLVALDEHGSISAAARARGVAQPTASAGLRTLERRLGIDLLVRAPRGTSLTETGRLVATWAGELVAASERFEEAVTALRTTTHERLRVAASLTVAEHLAPRWLAALAAAPRAGAAPDVELVVRNSRDVMDLVLADGADLGFVEGPGVRRGLRSRTVADDELVAVVAPTHPWAGRRTVAVGDLLRARLVVREAGSGTREVLEAALERAGHALPPHLPTMGSTVALTSAVVHGGAVTVVSALGVADDVARGSLARVSIAGLDLRRRLRLVWKDGAGLSATARRFAAVATRAGALLDDVAADDERGGAVE
ncbi:LysR family transcriptional regulator [Xylanimonas allomyrinae]|uniref:LysR family transcriptional regulator n=1 Tax=Xylanimonas allomyrinae TaxID=2509459 RepID=A0A4P6EJB1_9MICO|nr:LysR family transcriptional regulator [Xylanimonas allomyrinae]QAY62415.1 LysR family transcriptional regulator [Xylanimonas allomyrinae]